MIEGGVISYVRANHIGRPVFATNSAGVKVWSAVYTPFGGVHTSTGALPANRFPGQWFQSESGLHQNWMRDYDPTTGRYVQADPLGLIDGASVYGYALQNPMRFTDPTGEAIPAVVWGAIRLATYAYIAYEVYCADEWEDYLWIALDNLNPSKRLCPFCKAFGGGKGDPPGPGYNGGPFVPDEHWKKNAPDQVAPGSGPLEHWKYNDRTGNWERSVAEYDQFGRQNRRTDYTDHGYSNPASSDYHSNPHYHDRVFGPGYGPKGKGTRTNIE